MTSELRCGHSMFGELLPESKLRVKCSSTFCGHKRGGQVVFHTFNLATGELIDTQRYKDPRRRVDGDQQHG